MRLQAGAMMVWLALCAYSSGASAQSEIPGNVRNRMLGWSTFAGTAALALSAGSAALASMAASDSLSTGGAAVLTAALIGTTLFASAGFGYLAFRRRDRLASRRLDARLIPGVSSRAVGVSWLVRY